MPPEYARFKSSANYVRTVVSNCLEGVVYGMKCGTIIGAIQGDTGSLDYSLYVNLRAQHRY